MVWFAYTFEVVTPAGQGLVPWLKPNTLQISGRVAYTVQFLSSSKYGQGKVRSSRPSFGHHLPFRSLRNATFFTFLAAFFSAVVKGTIVQHFPQFFRQGNFSFGREVVSRPPELVIKLGRG